ncbi:alpha/beta hydrolase [Aestuariicella hydrocarbonica]|uniref:Alpha/beta hydrolase n=1 Tax=Pseudomaricurvus hydrocarbonicus TaxID=1470433 RepID=A0A9E5MNP4_9GAMM|nr:alpha/beta hydrolase [Aestuariicella hydrocarbonica]NHO67585.1 alpha/beta hydrolase [Aestuariicella hydrocarbonica]
MNIDPYYEQQGSGSPIVFIHGSYATTSTWKKMVEALAGEHQCILIKLPGHGGAPEAEDFSAPTVDTELAIIEQVVEALTDQPIHLVGHSYGGVVALSQALKGNLAVKQMTLFEPVAVWVLQAAQDRDMQQRVAEFLGLYRDEASRKVPYACSRVIDFWGGDGAFAPLPDFIKDGMEPLLVNNLRHWDVCTGIQHSLQQVQSCEVPTRVVYGTQSNPVAHAISDHLYQQLPNCQRSIIEGASHFLVTSHAQSCVDALLGE